MQKLIVCVSFILFIILDFIYKYFTHSNILNLLFFHLATVLIFSAFSSVIFFAENISLVYFFFNHCLMGKFQIKAITNIGTNIFSLLFDVNIHISFLNQNKE